MLYIVLYNSENIHPLAWKTGKIQTIHKNKLGSEQQALEIHATNPVITIFFSMSAEISIFVVRDIISLRTGDCRYVNSCLRAERKLVLSPVNGSWVIQCNRPRFSSYFGEISHDSLYGQLWKNLLSLKKNAWWLVGYTCSQCSLARALYRYRTLTGQ